MTSNLAGWVAWHGGYDVDGSVLRRRLGIVAGHLRRVVAGLPTGEVRLVSVCAGQGHDVVAGLAGHPRGGDVVGRLVELEAGNVAVAGRRLGEAGLGRVRVVQGDAGLADAYDGAVPADVVLVNGVFGNLTARDVRRTVQALPELCAPGASVIWTRHRQVPDRTVQIRRWFEDAGFQQVAVDAPEDELEIGVGVHRLVGEARALRGGRRWFTFSEAPVWIGESGHQSDR